MSEQEETKEYQDNLNRGKWGYCKHCGDRLHQAEQKRRICNVCWKWGLR